MHLTSQGHRSISQILFVLAVITLVLPALAQVICANPGVCFILIYNRWTDPTIIQKLPVCDTSPIESFCPSGEVVDVFSGHEVFCVVWPPTSSLRLWTSVEETLLLFCSCQKRPNEESQCTYSTARSGEQSLLLTTDYFWIWYGSWIMPYTERLIQQFSHTAQNMKYHIIAGT